LQTKKAGRTQTGDSHPYDKAAEVAWETVSARTATWNFTRIASFAKTENKLAKTDE